MATGPRNITQAIDSVVCYAPTMITANGIWQGVNPLSFSLPLFILQVVLVVLTTRILVLFLRPFRQPRVLAEIMGGIVLGPSVMGRWKAFGTQVFPQRSILTLETVAHLGLIYFLFLVGVEMDIMVIRQNGQKAIAIAVAGMVIPFSIGTATSFVFHHFVSTNIRQGSFLIFLGVALSVTAFPVLARILAETKLLNSEIGRISMSAAIINDMCAWILLALCIALSDPNSSVLSSLWVLLSGVAFILICFYCIRPAIWWLMRRIPEGQGVNDFHICLILSGVMLAGLTTDAIGIHSVFGAFVFGLSIPNGQLGLALIDKLEDFVTGLLLPLFFVISGLRTDLSRLENPVTMALLLLVFLLASAGKVIGTMVVALFYNMPLHEGVALGFLMNSRGLVEMIILNIGRDKQVLDDESFSVLVVISLAMTATVTPMVTHLHRPTRRLIGYKRRNLQRSKPDAELRMLACVHNTRNVPSIISLLEISHPTKRSPIFVYALHLVELTGRASAMLIVHTANITKPGSRRKPPAALTGSQAQSEHIFQAFESYEQHAGGVSVQSLTTISPYDTMHEDICSLAEEKHVALIVLPFHKQQTVDGGMEPINTSIKMLNENVLRSAPCSSGILLDRGLSSNSRIAPGLQHSHHVVLLFFGGPDDREALTLVWRMVEHPGITLTIVRFIAGDTVLSQQMPTPVSPPGARDSRVITIVTDSTREKQQDDEYLNEFRLRNVSNESVVYTEKVVNSSEDCVAAIRSMESIHDLYVVGRGKENATSSLIAGLAEWAECPELGPIGDLLASSDFSSTVSILVVQQYVGGSLGLDEPAPAEAFEQPVQQYLNNANQRTTVVPGTHRGTTAAFNVSWNGR